MNTMTPTNKNARLVATPIAMSTIAEGEHDRRSGRLRHIDRC